MSIRNYLRPESWQSASAPDPVPRTGSSHMSLKSYKILKATVLSLGVFAYGLFMVRSGANPDLALILTVALLAGINGIELREYLNAVAEAAAAAAANASGDGATGAGDASESSSTTTDSDTDDPNTANSDS